MKFLYLLLSFFFVLLFENTLGNQLILLTITNGLEIRISLAIKLFFFILNVVGFYRLKRTKISFNSIAIFLLFLFLSTCYTMILSPQFFISSLAQYIHIFLDFNIILFIFLYVSNVKQIFSFIKGMTYFAYFNAFLVIISFFFPLMISNFEAGTSEGGVIRSFGLMGDEVSLFLTFFLYKALVENKKYEIILFLSAIICTASIGATITTVFLFVYYFYKKTQFNKSLWVKAILNAFLLIFLLIIFASQLREFSLITRINHNLSGSEGGTWELRMLSLSNGFEMFFQRPFLGVGYGAYSHNVMENYRGVYESSGNEMSISTAGNIIGATYNPFLQIVCEAGLIGLAFFIYLIINFLKLLKTKLHTDSMMVKNLRESSYGWLLVFMITCLSANWFLPVSFLMLLIMTLVGLNMKLNYYYNQ